MNKELVILPMASYYDELKLENDHSIFVSLKMIFLISTLFPVFHICIFAYFIVSSPEQKAQGELIVWDSSRRPSLCASVRPFTLSNMNISETSWPIIIKFHQEHHWGGGLTALGFG